MTEVSALPRPSSPPAYPPSFLWGAGLSAHQHEGAFEKGEAGDWYRFEQQQPELRGIADTRRAADHWHRYAEDFQYAKDLGLNAVRISLAWEKIEPASGAFNTRAIEHYRQVLLELRRQGLQPLVVLQHGTVPDWFQLRGGWVSPDSPRLFLRYASTVIRELGGLCELWATFHEPVNYVIDGYLRAATPPQVHSIDAAYEAIYQIARAHRIVAAMIRDSQGLSIEARGEHGELRGVGIIHGLDSYDAYDPSDAGDLYAAATLNDLLNWSFIEGLAGTGLSFDVPREVPGGKSFQRDFPTQDLPPWSTGPSLDWLGIDYSTRYLVRYDVDAPNHFRLRVPKGPVGDDGRAIAPDGLLQTLRLAHRRVPMPVAVTGNGVADATDRLRARFIESHLEALDHALAGTAERDDTVDLRGYFYTSLLDGFEWLDGYEPRRGLIEVRYDRSEERVPRPSARAYGRAIERRRGQKPPQKPPRTQQ